MADPQASRFWLSSLQSGLLDLQSLTACWDGIPPDKREAVEHLDRRLARQAVRLNQLTLWQAQQLLAGRTSGFRVDRYLLLDLIGHGGMGRVYLARDTRLNRLVALKILAPERMNNPRAIARFQREARVGAQLQHENLVRIYDFGESSGRYFLVMEYIEGKTVGSLIMSQGAMPPPTAARLAQQIALGLEHAHRKGLIHRDVNPYNVLVTHEGIAKLADLGLAIDLAEEERVTREGATVGTFDYVAPEQARHSHSADIRSDIYSLGCTIYHMISGRVPFPSPSLPEKLFAHQAMEPEPLGRLVPSVPPGLVEVVQRMMRKLPEDRYATPLQVAQALEPFVEESARLHNGLPEPEPLIVEHPGQVAAVSAPPSSEVPAVELSPVNVMPPSGPEDTPTALPGSSLPKIGPDEEPSTPGVSPRLRDRQPVAVTPSILTPVNDNDLGSVEEIPLVLDLGPEPSLTETLTRSKPWFAPEKSGKTIAAPHPPSQVQRITSVLVGWLTPWQRYLSFLGLALVMAVLLLALVGYALLQWFSRDQSAIKHTRSNAVEPSSRNSKLAPSVLSGEGEVKVKEPDRRSGPAITVISRDGDETPVQDLYQAMETAVGAKGWVVLHNHEPLIVAASNRTVLSAGNDWLKIRGAQGISPVVVVELKGQRPFLTVGSGMNLILEGLTIVARYVDQPSGNGVSPPPIILAGGPAKLSHCAFLLEGSDGPSGSRAIVAEGGNLTVENTWFRGFDTALDVHAIGNSTALLRQTITIPGTMKSVRSTTLPASSPPIQRGTSGWGVRMEFLGGDQAGGVRKLILDHCTVSGAGLIQLAGFSPGSPLQVQAQGCAVQTGALIAWEPATPQGLWNPQTLQWEGEGNQFDITGPSWVVPAVKGTSTLHLITVNREGWSRIAKERVPLSGEIQFLTRPDASPEKPEPEDFAIKGDGLKKVGADPEQVGPRSARLSQSKS